jgi:hypothetical protein
MQANLHAAEAKRASVHCSRTQFRTALNLRDQQKSLSSAPDRTARNLCTAITLSNLNLSAPAVRQVAWPAAASVPPSVTTNTTNTTSTPALHIALRVLTCFHACLHPACPVLLSPSTPSPQVAEIVRRKSERTPNLSTRLWKHAWKTVPALQEPMASGVRVEIDCGRGGHVEGGRRSVGGAKRTGVEEVWKVRPPQRKDMMLWKGRRHACEGRGR